MNGTLSRAAFGALLAGLGAAAEASERLTAVLEGQPDAVKARYEFRHPAETLAFFGVEPGMTVMEALPGGGWYTKILLPYLGADGKLLAADYAIDLYALFGFMTEEALEEKRGWAEAFEAQAATWAGDQGAAVEAFAFGSLPESLHGTADVVLFVRALHNLARFEERGGFLTQALADAHALLEPGGILGVVQHEAPADVSDAWASGQRGYLKKAWVIGRVEAAGFELIAESDVNANPKDQPGEEDVVWRLPPSLATSREDPHLRTALEAVGESNRMTLKFRKIDG